MNFSGKEGHPNIQPSTRPGIEPGTSGLGGRDLNPSAPPLHCTSVLAPYNFSAEAGPTELLGKWGGGGGGG